MVFSVFWKCRNANCCTSIEAEILQKREQNRREQHKKERMREFKQRTEIDCNLQINTSNSQNELLENDNPDTSQNTNLQPQAKREIMLTRPSMIITKESVSVPVTADNASYNFKLPPKLPSMKSSHSAILHKEKMPKKRRKAFEFFGLTESLLTHDHQATTLKNVRHRRSNTVKSKERVLPHSPLELDVHSASLPINLFIRVDDLDEFKYEIEEKDPNKLDNLRTPDSPLVLGTGNGAYSVPIPMDNDKRTLEQDYNAHSVPISGDEINDEVEKSMGSVLELTDADSFVFLEEEEKGNRFNINVDTDMNKMMKQDDSRRVTKATPIVTGGSRPSVIDTSSIDLEKVCKSLQILVDYGFCSRVSMNNIKQLQRYRANTMQQLEQQVPKIHADLKTSATAEQNPTPMTRQ